MLALTDVVHFLAHEFARLGARGLPLPPIPACPLDGPLLWHVNLPVNDADRAKARKANGKSGRSLSRATAAPCQK